MSKKSHKINQIQNLTEKYPDFFRLETLGSVDTRKGAQPLLRFELRDFKNSQEDAPVFGLFAGVHGIEAVGVSILYAFLDHLLEQTLWNGQVQDLLRRIKIVGIPVVNPAGYFAGSRCNGNGVDLMRNSPVECSQPTPFVGGHRYSARLPYFRGTNGFEFESLRLLEVVERDLWNAPFSLSLDLHSGFGSEDYLWTPYAHRSGFPENWHHYEQIKCLLDRTLKNHVYRFEPQSVHYRTSGDLWDYLFMRALEQDGCQGLFLPLTLEVGSWIWLKKSPSKALRIRNYFNPAHPHRKRRVLRRHLLLLNFLANLVADYSQVFSVNTVRSGRRVGHI